MASICGTDCCENCAQRKTCGGCEQTNGRPFGRQLHGGRGGPARRAGRTFAPETGADRGVQRVGAARPAGERPEPAQRQLCQPGLPAARRGRRPNSCKTNRVYWGNQIEVPRQRALLTASWQTRRSCLSAATAAKAGTRNWCCTKRDKAGLCHTLGRGAAQFAPPLRVCLFAGVLLFSVPPGTCVVSSVPGGAAEHAFCASACEKEETPVFSFSRGVSEKFPALSMYQIRLSRPVWLL